MPSTDDEDDAVEDSAEKPTSTLFHGRRPLPRSLMRKEFFIIKYKISKSQDLLRWYAARFANAADEEDSFLAGSAAFVSTTDFFFFGGFCVATGGNDPGAAFFIGDETGATAFVCKLVYEYTNV